MSRVAYPNEAKITAMVQDRGLNRTGLIADCIFPAVQTPCHFGWIDWDNDANNDALKQVTSKVTGCATVHEIDRSGFVLKYDKVEADALDVPLCDDCQTHCSPTVEALFNDESRAAKEAQDRILIGYELNAIEKAFNHPDYSTPVTADPLNEVVEGTRFDLVGTTGFSGGLADESAKIRTYFDNIQANAEYRRDTAVMSYKAYLMIRRHPQFLKGGCNVDPLATQQMVAELLGVSKICIADARYDGAAPGLASNMQRFLNDKILLLTNNTMNATQEVKRTFGFAATVDDWYSYKHFDPKMGAKGTEIIRVGRKKKPIVADYRLATVVENIFA